MYPRTSPSRRVRRILSAGAVLAALLIALSSCGQHLTNVDPQLTLPVGTTTPDAQLIVWPDQPNTIYVFDDTKNPGPDANDPLIGTLTLPVDQPATLTIDGMILDHTGAGEFQVFRTESNGGVRQFLDFAAGRTKRWLNSQWEIYRFADPTPSGHQPPVYIGRGLLGGVANGLSPLTNLGVLNQPIIGNLNLTAVWTKHKSVSDPPLQLKINWDRVPNAVRYWVHVFEYRSDVDFNEEVLSGRPAPFYDAKTHDYLVSYVDDPQDSVTISPTEFTALADAGDDLGTVLYSAPIADKQELVVRVSAVDAAGRMIATVRGPDDLHAALPWDTNTNKPNLTVNRYVEMLPLDKAYVLYRLNGAVTADLNASTGGGGGPGEPMPGFVTHSGASALRAARLPGR